MSGDVSELEAQIAADPEELARYAVLGDALVRAGDPRGELIALQLAAQAQPPGKAADKLRAAAEAHFAAHAKAFLGPLAPHAARLTWRSGFIRRMELAASARVDVAALLPQALAHPSGRFVVELALQVDGAAEGARLLAALAAAAPRSLRDLDLILRGELGAELGPLLPRVPWLERLNVTAQRIEIGAPSLPALRRLRLAALTLTSTCVQALAEAAWPALERLELRFGTRDDPPATFADVRPLLLHTALPRLTHLRLRNAPFAGGVLRELLSAPLATQLAVLDLSHGSMSPADAAALVTTPTRLAHLRELWLPMRLLRGVDKARLAGLGRWVIDDVRAARDELEAVLMTSGYSGL